MEPDPHNPFMTISDVMAALKVSRGTVRNLVKDGKLRVVRPRPHVPRILREDVLRLAEPAAFRVGERAQPVSQKTTPA